MRRYDIGESFWEDGREIVCVPGILDGDPKMPSCMGCVFAGRGMVFCAHIACTASERADGVQAHFWAVEDMGECALRDIKNMKNMCQKFKNNNKK